MRSRAAIALLVAANSAITGCAASAGAAPPSGAAPSGATVRLGYFPNITHAPAIVGVENGFFRDAVGTGTTLETVTFNAGPSAIEALFNEAVDMTYIGPNPAIN